MARTIFRPTSVQQRFFRRIRKYVCGHSTEFVDAAALVIRLTEAKAKTMDHAENQTFARLVSFARESSTWDLTHLRSAERLLRARAIVYVTWLLTDADAADRGVGLTAMERTPMLAPDSKIDEPGVCLDRGWAKWEVFDPKGDSTRAWWRQLKLAWDELRVTSVSPRGSAGAAARAGSTTRPLPDTQRSGARRERTRPTAREGWIALMAAVDQFGVPKTSLHDWTNKWSEADRRRNQSGRVELRLDRLKNLLRKKNVHVTDD